MKKKRFFIIILLTTIISTQFTTGVEAIFNSKASFHSNEIKLSTTEDILNITFGETYYKEEGYITSSITISNKTDISVPLRFGEIGDVVVENQELILSPHETKSIKISMVVPESKSVSNHFQLLGFSGSYINEYFLFQYNPERLVYSKQGIVLTGEEQFELKDSYSLEENINQENINNSKNIDKSESDKENNVNEDEDKDITENILENDYVNDENKIIPTLNDNVYDNKDDTDIEITDNITDFNN